MMDNGEGNGAETTEDSAIAAVFKFAKMVKQQLKKAYNVDVKRLSKKTDKHGQPKASIKVGSGDSAVELWFRAGNDESIVVDAISDGKAEGTTTIQKPICHLRAAAKIDNLFNMSRLPKKSQSEETGSEEADDEDTIELDDTLDESVDHEEPEDFEEEFSAPTNKFAIVDASVIEGLDNELIENAIFVPVKHPGVVLSVAASYDDAILRNVTISPAEVQQGDVDVVKTEGIAPLSHDSSPERAVRKHTSVKQKHHMSNVDKVPGRIKDPAKKGAVKRNKVERDKRRKQRQAESVELVKSVINGEVDLKELDTDKLEFVEKVLSRDKWAEHGMEEKLGVLSESVRIELDGKKKANTEQLLEYVKCLRVSRKNPRNQMTD
jgi:hypothetical protein